MALSKRADVEKVLGKPLAYKKRQSLGEIGDEADYPWGMAGYVNSRLIFVTVKFPVPPADYVKAFALLGLPAPNAPYVRDGDRTMIWKATTFNSGFNCCDSLSIDDIFIDGKFSEMHVYLIDLDSPSSRTDAESRMWEERTRQPLPSPAI
jgi:hypothetical protein